MPSLPSLLSAPGGLIFAAGFLCAGLLAPRVALAAPPALEQVYKEREYQRDLPFEPLEAGDEGLAERDPSPGFDQHPEPRSPGAAGKPKPVCVPGKPGPGEEGCDLEDGSGEQVGGTKGKGGSEHAEENGPPPPVEIEVPVDPAMTPQTMTGIWLPLLVLVGVVGLLLLLAYILMRPGAAPSERTRPEGGGEALEEEDTLIQGLEQETQGLSAEQWAERVDYDRAIHALLLRALRALIAQRHALSAPSLTSREILTQAALPPGTKAHLHTLVSETESIRFAQRPADKARYEACTMASAAFLAALEGGNAKGGAL